tara:strand:+ start:2097 stop:2273 length:177 start_codon:yes stop_codon:yes gene_type:complete
MIDINEKLILLNVINHWKFKEVEAEVKRLRQGIIDIADKWERPSILRGFLKELMELIE